MPHGRHIYAKTLDMEKATLCAYLQWDNALPHWKCVFRCCAKCPSINIYYQETDDQYTDTNPSIIFHVYHIIACISTHIRLPLTNNKNCRKFQHDTASGKPTKIYTRKELVFMETTISNFHTSFYIPKIQKLAFHIPHVQILGKNQCGEYHRTAFKRRWSFQYVVCCHDYAERLVARFSHQIQS